MGKGEIDIRYIQISEQEYKYLKESSKELSLVLEDMEKMENEISSLRGEVAYLRGNAYKDCE